MYTYDEHTYLKMFAIIKALAKCHSDNVISMPPTRASPIQGSLAPKPKIDLIKAVDQATAQPGDVIMYTITFTVSKADAYDIWLNEAYPPGTTFLNATPAPTLGDSGWYWPYLAQGSTITIFINVSIDLGVANETVLINNIDVSWTDGGTRPVGSDSDSAETTVIIIPEFGLSPLYGIAAIGIVFLLGRKRSNIFHDSGGQ